MRGLANAVIIYPDYVVRSHEERGEFVHKLLDAAWTHGFKHRNIVPVLNGADEETLEELVAAEKGRKLDAIASKKPGLTEALVAGYRHCISKYPQQTVVRLDTAEHDPEYMAKLALRAENTKGHVVGDLSFESWQLEPGSADEFAHQLLFPMVSGLFLKTINISCAHGYAAVYGPALPKILDGAMRIANNFKDADGVLPCWGFDEAMIISAVKQGIPTEVYPVPAMALRNRPPEKVLAQAKNSLQMYMAAERLDWSKSG